MLTVTIPPLDVLDLETLRIHHVQGGELTLEHSLHAIAMWESKWHIPFLRDPKRTNAKPLTTEQLQSYIECMTVTPVEDKRIFTIIPNEVYQQISDYMNDTMTATTFKEDPNRPHRGGSAITTNEQIYYMMAKLNIPFECQHWHLNRLLTLIRVAEESENPRKMSKSEILKQNRELNRARQASRRR